MSVVVAAQGPATPLHPIPGTRLAHLLARRACICRSRSLEDSTFGAQRRLVVYEAELRIRREACDGPGGPPDRWRLPFWQSFAAVRSQAELGNESRDQKAGRDRRSPGRVDAVFEAEAFHFFVERGAVDAQYVGRRVAVPTVEFEVMKVLSVE